MKHSEWLICGARIGELWPNRGWPQETLASAYDLFARVPQPPVLQAIAQLAAAGREFAPAPGVVLSKALQVLVASTPALADPDLTRPLTPEEAERARRMGAALTGKKADLVVATWIAFAGHARLTLNAGETAEAAAERIKACDGRCERVALRCRMSGLHSHRFAPWWDELCEVGKALFEAWRSAVDELRMMPSDSVQQEAAL